MDQAGLQALYLIFIVLCAGRWHGCLAYFFPISVSLPGSSIILSIGAGLQAQVSDSTVSESVNTLRVTYEPDKQSMMQAETPPFRYQDFSALENIDGVEKVEQSNDMFSGMMGLRTEAQYFEQKAYLTLELYRSQRPPLMAGGCPIFFE
ncbi:hypothetical protein SSCH_1370008 [Syntrophaceticus schinkii]|jgi:putative ABC transport system permease protein|uniref:Uncharacterized protein n=2 Tax=Syntrophaceticus schinkii TaxID=499207 RepID=A0A0B7MBR9_9FIRM|nr:hypothetical protein SSCH_1370008 [Syntrophaceticus schinkii]